MDRRHWIALVLATAAGSAAAQAYPNKIIKLQVPFAPGGTTDIIARVIADPLGKALGQSVIVENKAGGGGIVGANETAKSAPDGYTLGIATVSTTAANPAINPKTPYNPLTDFTPIINIAATPNIIAVHPSFPAKDYKGFVAELKKSAGKYSYSSSGTGGIGHLQMELYKSLTGTFVTHIPYRGAGPALNDTVAGQVPMILTTCPRRCPSSRKTAWCPSWWPHRSAWPLPNVPTFKEVGLEPVNRMAYYGIVGPKGLPKDVVDKVNAAVRKALEDPAVKKRIEDTGSIVVGNTPEQFAEQIKTEFSVYKDVVAKAKAHARLSTALKQSRAGLACAAFFMARTVGVLSFWMLEDSLRAIDTFVDALWLEDGLSRNTLAAYRRDLTLYAQWLAQQQPPLALDATAEMHLSGYFAARHAQTRATSANRRLTVLRRYFHWALRERRITRDPPCACRLHASPCGCPKPCRRPMWRPCSAPPDLGNPWACATAPCWS